MHMVIEKKITIGVHRIRGNLCHIVVLILIILIPFHVVSINKRLYTFL